MEGVALEAGVGKPTLYRRWSNKAAIITEALPAGYVSVPDLELSDDANDVWDGLEIWLTAVAEQVQGPYGELLRASTAIVATDADLGAEIVKRFSEPPKEVLVTYLRRGIQRGEVKPDADLDSIVDVAWAMVMFVGTTRADVGRLPRVVNMLRRAESLSVEDDCVRDD